MPQKKSISDEQARRFDIQKKSLREYHPIPPAIEEGLERYLKLRVRPGDFLYACLTNDLKGAIVRADFESRRSLQHIVMWIMNGLPFVAQGTTEKVERWLRGGEQ